MKAVEKRNKPRTIANRIKDLIGLLLRNRKGQLPGTARSRSPLKTLRKILTHGFSGHQEKAPVLFACHLIVFKQPQLQLLGFGHTDRVIIGKAGVTIMMGKPWSCGQHALQAQIA